MIDNEKIGGIIEKTKTEIETQTITKTVTVDFISDDAGFKQSYAVKGSSLVTTNKAEISEKSPLGIGISLPAYPPKSVDLKSVTGKPDDALIGQIRNLKHLKEDKNVKSNFTNNYLQYVKHELFKSERQREREKYQRVDQGASR